MKILLVILGFVISALLLICVPIAIGRPIELFFAWEFTNWFQTWNLGGHIIRGLLLIWLAKKLFEHICKLANEVIESKKSKK